MAEDKITIDVLTLDSVQCAACGYMMESIAALPCRRAGNDCIQGMVDQEQRRYRQVPRAQRQSSADHLH